MHEQFSGPARWMGIGAATTILVTGLAYGVTLALGIASLPSPDQPILNPYFTMMEALILLLAPAMVALMAAVHFWAPAPLRPLSLTALCLMVMLATETCCVHFVILTLAHQPGIEHRAMLDSMLAFKWPSVVYALDILGWDIFFALSMLFAAAVFSGRGLARGIRIAMITSAVLSFAGLSGVIRGNMQLRNIGIAGYLGAFLVVDIMLLLLFVRSGAGWTAKDRSPER
jgi:hypothetical protein